MLRCAETLVSSMRLHQMLLLSSAESQLFQLSTLTLSTASRSLVFSRDLLQAATLLREKCKMAISPPITKTGALTASSQLSSRQAMLPSSTRSSTICPPMLVRKPTQTTLSSKALMMELLSQRSSGLTKMLILAGITTSGLTLLHTLNTESIDSRDQQLALASSMR